jgi:hypothetical protein
MKLTIIPADGSVGEDGKFYLELDLSSCGIPSNVHALQWDGVAGWIEFNEPIPNESITELPAWTTCCMTKWAEANNPPPVPPTAEQIKQVAIQLLQNTDWATISDVADPLKSNPYLSNAQDFVVYRNAVRQYAINPVAEKVNWPDVPQAIWLNT